MNDDRKLLMITAAIVLLAYLVSLFLFLATRPEAEEATFVLPAAAGEGRARGDDAEEKDLIITAETPDTSLTAPTMGGGETDEQKSPVASRQSPDGRCRAGEKFKGGEAADRRG